MKASKNFKNYEPGSFKKASFSDVSACKFIENNFIATKHFYDRMFERGITSQRIEKTVKEGQRFYFVSKGRILTKYYHNNLVIVIAKDQYDKIPNLLTGFFFKRKPKNISELYRILHLGNLDNFMLTEI